MVFIFSRSMLKSDAASLFFFCLLRPHEGKLSGAMLVRGYGTLRFVTSPHRDTWSHGAFSITARGRTVPAHFPTIDARGCTVEVMRADERN